MIIQRAYLLGIEEGRVKAAFNTILFHWSEKSDSVRVLVN